MTLEELLMSEIGWVVEGGHLGRDLDLRVREAVRKTLERAGIPARRLSAQVTRDEVVITFTVPQEAPRIRRIALNLR